MMVGILGIESFESKVDMCFNTSGNRAGRRLSLQNGNVVFFAFNGSGKKPNIPLPGADDQVLSGMPFLLTGVVGFLLFRIFWSLNRTFRPVDEHFFCFGKCPEKLLDIP